MGLFEFHFDVIFVIYRFFLTVFGVLRSPRFCRGSCQVGKMVPYKLSASSLKHKDSCFHRLQTFCAKYRRFRVFILPIRRYRRKISGKISTREVALQA